MLALSSVRVSIEGVKVMRGVTFSLSPGRATVLVGRNGAGKTTTLRAIMGLLPLEGGEITLGARNLGVEPSHRRAFLGIGYAPEDRRLIAAFSVEDNLLLPALALNLPLTERRRRLDEVYELLPELKGFRLRMGGALSGGQGKMVALGRALMVARAALLLDEPLQGLAPALALEYARTLGRLRAARPDLTLLVTESSPKLLASIADDMLRIERGEVEVINQTVE